tara:strand:+ start:737 stop:991 length:255 start_codon:yes stop_codon:yes gene_type:complete
MNVFYVTLKELEDEKAKLLKDFEQAKQQIIKLETDVLQMKNNLQALNGAIQFSNRVIEMATEHGKKGDWKVEERRVKAESKKKK